MSDGGADLKKNNQKIRNLKKVNKKYVLRCSIYALLSTFLAWNMEKFYRFCVRGCDKTFFEGQIIKILTRNLIYLVLVVDNLDFKIFM